MTIRPVNSTLKTLMDVDGTCYEGRCFINGTLHGQGTIEYPNGDRYEGDVVEGKEHGRGVYRYKNGYTYEGAFKERLFHGDGTFQIRGILLYRGPVSYGSIILRNQTEAMKQRGSLGFLSLLTGREEIPLPQAAYAGGTLSAHLFLRHPEYRRQAEAIRSIYTTFSLSPGNTSEERIASIFQQVQRGQSILLAFGSYDHAMLLEISPNLEGIDCHLYNSGYGLHHHVHSRYNPRKHQTQLTIRIPQSAWTESFVNSIVNYRKNSDVDSSYQLFLQIPGAFIVRENPKTAIWQTQQKSKNCALECFNAYLKNSLQEPAYTDFRRRLFIECKKTSEDHPSLSLEEKQSFSAELDRKIAKRERKLRAFQNRKY